jgi:ankyrin repeat protein
MAALHYACAKGYAEVVRLLLEKGANAEAKNKVTAFRAVHMGYVAFPPPINLFIPCLTASSVSDCREEKRR